MQVLLQSVGVAAKSMLKILKLKLKLNQGSAVNGEYALK